MSNGERLDISIHIYVSARISQDRYMIIYKTGLRK